MIRRLVRWLARHDVAELERLLEATGEALVKAQGTNVWLRTEIARHAEGCVQRPICVRHTAELDRLKTQARAET